MRQAVSKIIITLLLSVFLVTCFFLSKWLYFLYTPLLNSKTDITYQVVPGNTLFKLAHELHRKGLLKKPKYFILLGQIKRQTQHIKAGEYLFKAQSTPSQILDQLTSGRVIQYHIIFIEGWTFKEVKATIAENKILNHQLKTIHDQELMVKLGQGEQSPEGLFFPDTYNFTRGMSDIDLLKRAYKTMQEKLLAAWFTRAANTSYKSPREALIVASLVEKESALAQERPLIAGIILQRLQKKMLLQIDPTVIYGLGDRYLGKLSKNDLKNDSPYNTYRYHGLPPTPIALPSAQSINAALHPRYSDYLYFVAKGDGSHYFSKTLEEQRQAIKKYLIKIN